MDAMCVIDRIVPVFMACCASVRFVIDLCVAVIAGPCVLCLWIDDVRCCCCWCGLALVVVFVVWPVCCIAFGAIPVVGFWLLAFVACGVVGKIWAVACCALPSVVCDVLQRHVCGV